MGKKPQPKKAKKKRTTFTAKPTSIFYIKKKLKSPSEKKGRHTTKMNANRQQPTVIKTINKVTLLNAITHEGEHREALKQPIDIWEYRKSIIEKLGEHAMDAIITNAGGKKGNHVKMGEMLKEKFGEGTPEEYVERIDVILKAFNEGVRYSRWKEKFYRYVYRKEKDNAQKYHEKMAEDEIRMIEESRQIHADGGNVGYAVNHAVNGGGHETFSREEGFRKYCAEMKKAHKTRQDLLACLPN